MQRYLWGDWESAAVLDSHFRGNDGGRVEMTVGTVCRMGDGGGTFEFGGWLVDMVKRKSPARPGLKEPKKVRAQPKSGRTLPKKNQVSGAMIGIGLGPTDGYLMSTATVSRHSPRRVQTDAYHRPRVLNYVSCRITSLFQVSRQAVRLKLSQPAAHCQPHRNPNFQPNLNPPQLALVNPNRDNKLVNPIPKLGAGQCASSLWAPRTP